MPSTEQIAQFVEELSESDRILVDSLMWPDTRPSETQQSLQFQLPEHQAPEGTFQLLINIDSLGNTRTKRHVFVEKDELNPEKLTVRITIKSRRPDSGARLTRFSFGINTSDQIYDFKSEEDLPPEEMTIWKYTRAIIAPPLEEVLGFIHEAILIEPTLHEKAS